MQEFSGEFLGIATAARPVAIIWSKRAGCGSPGRGPRRRDRDRA
jgi:hypothetical protein